jgi:hypothetical protein
VIHIPCSPIIMVDIMDPTKWACDIAQPDSNNFILLPEKPENAFWFKTYQENLAFQWLFSLPHNLAERGALYRLTSSIEWLTKQKARTAVQVTNQFVCLIPYSNCAAVRLLVWKMVILYTLLESFDFKCEELAEMSITAANIAQNLQLEYDRRWA